MWTFLFSFLFLRRMGLSNSIRYALAVLMIGLLIVVLIYTACLLLTLEERKSVPYAATYSIY
ncbi:hypothetical protein ACOBR2_11705 [Telmatobacter bradus]|jgi:hypothetical protein|uniref:hypothetical protein n=1 Tax=Telmatobacter bradus TaxID=474953 RepID=UPI003B43B02A